MSRVTRQPIRFDDLPLFVARDSDLAEAIVGADPERKQIWLAGLPRLEACGFPRVTPGQGRYRPAVKAFYDRFYGLDAVAPLPAGAPTESITRPTARGRRRF